MEEDVPELVNKEEQKPKGPIIDADGFEVVTEQKGKRRRWITNMVLINMMSILIIY